MIHSHASRRLAASVAATLLLATPSFALAVEPPLFVPGDSTYGYAIEDINGNGVLDAGEDLNGNGVLDNNVFIVPASIGQVLPFDWLAPSNCIIGNSIELEGGSNVISSGNYANGCTVNFDWNYYFTGPPTYTDQLHVCFGTDGEVNTWPGGIINGIDVVLNPASNKVDVRLFNPPNDPSVIQSGNFTFVQGQSYNVSVTHNPNGTALDTIVVKINGTVVVTATIPAGFESAGDNVLIHNRESVAGCYHWSNLENTNITPLPAPQIPMDPPPAPPMPQPETIPMP